MSKKTYYWLKLKNDFFIQPKIKKLRRIAGGDTYTLIYLKLQLLSLQHEGVLLFDGVEDSFVEELALTIDETVENVQVTVQFLISQGLLEEVSADSMLLPETVKSIGSECRQAECMRNLRESRKKQSVTKLPDVTKSYTEIEIEKELELELELEKDTHSKHTGDFASPDSVDADFYHIAPSTPNEKSTMYEEDLVATPSTDENFQPHAVGKCDFPNSGKKPRKKKAFVPPTLEEVRAYVAERGSPVDADYFFDYYNVENWTVGGKPVLSWKMKLVTWEKNNKKNCTTNDTFGVTFNSPTQTNETTTGGEADEHKPFAGCY